LFRQNKSKRVTFFLCCLIGILAGTVFHSAGKAQKIDAAVPPADKPSRLIGRVLADVSSLVFGAGLGPKHTVFVFAVEQDGGARVLPVKVSYAFFKQEGPPPDSFFDYTKRYELQAVRDSKCDETVSSLSYVKNADQSGKPLKPTDVLRYLDGAPKDAMNLDTVLPCYDLRPGGFKCCWVPDPSRFVGRVGV
jgi:hypothetical protein